MDPFQIKFHHFRTNKNPKIHISELPKSPNPEIRKIGPYSSGRHFSESCSPRKMMQNRIDKIFWGQTFKNTPYFNLRASGSWTWDLGTKILVPRAWYQDLKFRNQGPVNWNKGCFWKFGPRIFRLYGSASFCRGAQLSEKCLPDEHGFFSGNLEVQIYEFKDFHLFKNHGIWFETGSYGSVGTHI